MINNIFTNGWAIVMPILMTAAILIGLVDKTKKLEGSIVTPLGIAYGAVCGIISCVMIFVESFNGLLALIVPTEEAGTFEDGLNVLVFTALIAAAFGILTSVIAGLSKTISSKALAHEAVTIATTSAAPALSDNVPAKAENIEFEYEEWLAGGPEVGQALCAPRLDGVLKDKIPPKADDHSAEPLRFGRHNDDKAGDTEHKPVWTKVKGVFGGGLFLHGAHDAAKAAKKAKGSSINDDSNKVAETAEDQTSLCKDVPPLCPGGGNVKVSVQGMCRIAKELEATGNLNKVVDAPIVENQDT